MSNYIETVLANRARSDIKRISWLGIKSTDIPAHVAAPKTDFGLAALKMYSLRQRIARLDEDLQRLDQRRYSMTLRALIALLASALLILAYAAL